MKAAFAIIVAAVVVVVAFVLYLGYGGFFIPRGTATGNGQLIYTRGVDASGTMIGHMGGPPMMGMMGYACINCHGADGRGGYYPAMCGTVSADIRYTSLITAGYTNSTIKRAITQGLDESGDPLASCMPHWIMSDTDLNDVVNYLAQLG